MINDFQDLLPGIVYIYYWEEKRNSVIFKGTEGNSFQAVPLMNWK
jgi:hypothetical protein